ncbi:MAG TPA: hypothetical protein VFP64_02055 [Pyrinomonadaceae bacterium]|nr:hypothetical protein [Pyrinomonadaceae bacterium]
MEFFLNQQAQFDADMEKFRETQRELQETTKATAEGLAELRTLTYEGFKLSAERFEVVARNFEVVTEKFSHTDALFSNTDARINALIDAQLRTEEKIKNTDAKVDHHLKEDHNGDRKPNNP